MVLILDDGEIGSLLDVGSLLDPVRDALVKQAAGAVERPQRPHFPVGAGLDGDEPHGTALTMPAYVHGEEHYVTKLASVHEENPERGLPAVQAQIVLTEARTGRPAAYMAGTRITNARTGCVGGLAVRALASEPVRLAVIGAGAQARWQTRAIAAAATVEDVRVYSPSDSRFECAADLRDEGIPASAADSAADAVRGATVVVTATTAAEPVFPPDALTAELVIAVGAYDADTRELDAAVLERAATVFAGVPVEAAETGDVLPTDLGPDDLVPLAAALTGEAGDLVVVESVGSAVLDLAAATAVYERAQGAGVGRELSLSGENEGGSANGGGDRDE
ncbi:ornithine cyclodeaminase family protein [Halostella sp. JP-L12]|uniref:ornithine cyclodeaminase family protein n=1 Tax=Halostella TaxID=1843185 RepID=UPI000EF81883|nr:MULTISPECIES: ornithine cyclodeaminase family protein [Halostella]NHN48409.1 ornithine cyclodeaminase family protein [Halostella sp. JP-L12]